MAFVNAKTGKQVKLEKGYLSNPVDYQTFVKQQEARRQSAAPASTAARAGGTPSARPSTASLQNQLRQAQVDLDTDAMMRINKQLKEERARQGKQTVGDRVSDTLSSIFSGSAGGYVNAAGTVAEGVKTPGSTLGPEARQKAVTRLQASLDAGRTTDGKPLSQAQRKSIQEAIRRLSGGAEPSGFAAKAYKTADMLQGDSARFQQQAKEGLGKVGSLVVDAGVSTGQSLLDNALGAVTGTGMLPFVARSFGGAAQEARQSGADTSEQLAYGAGQAAKEYVTEKLFGLTGPQRLTGGGSLDDAIEKGIRNTTERLAKTQKGQKALGVLMTWLSGGATEGAEEVIGSVLENTLVNPFLRAFDPDGRTARQKFEDGLYDALVGAASGLMGGVTSFGYQVSPQSSADAHVRGTLEMMQRAAGMETAQNATQTAPGARPEAVVGTDTTATQNAARAPQTAPENIFTQTADAIRKEGDAHVRGTLELMQRAAGLETGQQETAPGTGTVVADTSLFERSVLNNFNTARKNLIEFARKHFPASVINAETGKSIGLSRKGLDKFLSGNITYDKYASGFHIPELIERAHKVGDAYNYHPETAESIPTFEYYDSPIQIDGKDYTAHIRVKNSLVGDKYYGHTVSEVEDIKIEPPTRTSSPETPAVQPENTGGPMESPASGLSAVNEADNFTSETTEPGLSASTIPQGADSVKPGIMEQEIQRLFGSGKRLSPGTLTEEQRTAVDAANNLGFVDMDAENRLYQVNPEDHIDRRDTRSAGDKRLRAFQFDHPQLHPYYVQAAETLAAELEHYMPGGETASRVSEDGNIYSYRMGRSATPHIAELIDRYGVKPSQIGNAIEAIIQDRGQENYAAAKRLELLLDDMLTSGYQDAATGEFIQPNQDYIAMKEQIAGAVNREANMGTGLDGIGAADAGSLNSDYDRLQAQSSRFHPEGANAARPVDVPMQDFEGYNIPKSASTMMGAASLHNENVRQLEQMVADGILSFGTIHDGDALLYADKILKEKGFDAALERYRNDVQSNVATKGNTALGQLLMRDAAALGNTDALAEIFHLYAANSTTIAQAMQAQSMLRKLPPESQLVTVQKALDTLNEKYQLDLKMDPADVQDFMGAESQEAREAVRQRIVEKAAKEVPSTFRAKYDAVRYLAMLGNPKTHIRNIIGNLAFQIPATAKNRLGALAERGAQALGADVERTKSLTGVNPFGDLAKEARADWSNAKPFLEGSKYSEGKVTAGAIEQEAKPFQNSNALGKAVGWAADKNGALLEAEDNLFKQWIYSQSLAGYLKANGVKSISEADPALLNRARNYAAQEALRNTFNDKNAFSDFVAKAGSARNSKNPFAKGASYVVEGVLPFKRTPANVLARAVEYSPLGALTDIGKLFYRAKTGKATQETIVRDLDRLAAGLSGSALLGLGWLLSGMISGGEDPDEEQRKFDDLTGHQNYALELDNGTSITLDWLAPSAIPFFMGVELAHAWQDGGLTPEEALNALKSIGEPMLEMSMLQGLNDVFEDAAYAQQHGGSVPAALMVNAATNYLTQAAPTLFGQLERSAEGQRMTTYGDKNSPLSQDAQFFLGKLSQKVPGWDYNQIPYLDAWGREEETGDPVERVFNNFFNPSYVSQVQVDQVERELQRIKDATGDGGVFPRRADRYFTVNKEQKNLTAEEYQTYAKKRGQTSMEVLRSMMNSLGYQNLSDEKKAEAISDAYSYADALGKMAVSDYRPGDGTVAAGALKTMLPPAAYILYRMNKDRDGDGKVTNLESTQTLQELPDLSDKQRGKAWKAMNERTNPARNPFTGALAKDGMTPEESATAWGIYGRSGTKEEPYTKKQKKQDLREELDLTTQEVNRLWNLMVKAAEKK